MATSATTHLWPSQFRLTWAWLSRMAGTSRSVPSRRMIRPASCLMTAATIIPVVIFTGGAATTVSLMRAPSVRLPACLSASMSLIVEEQNVHSESEIDLKSSTVRFWYAKLCTFQKYLTKASALLGVGAFLGGVGGVSVPVGGVLGADPLPAVDAVGLVVVGPGFRHRCRRSVRPR